MNILVNSLVSPIASFPSKVFSTSEKWGSELPQEDIFLHHVKYRISQMLYCHKDEIYALCLNISFLSITKPSWDFRDIICSEKFTMNLSGRQKIKAHSTSLGATLRFVNSHQLYSSNCFLSLTGIRIASYMVKDVMLLFVVIYGNILASKWAFPITINLIDSESLTGKKNQRKNMESTYL